MKIRKIIKPDGTLRTNLMSFGFDCGRGWYPLIEETLDKIEALLPEDSDFEILQVKEKWGMLEIYTNWSTDEIDDIITSAREKSIKICEACGAPGNLMVNNGWYVTLCAECDEKRRK